MRTILSLLLAFSLMLTSLSCLSAKAPVDIINNHWAEDTLQSWIEREWFPYDEAIRPNDHVTRAEFSALVNQAFNFTSTAQSVSYKDLPLDHWAYQQISIAFKAGYMQGNESNQIEPDRPASRQETALMLSLILDLDKSQDIQLSMFTDSSTIAEWSQSAISSLVAAQILKGDSNGEFRPRALMTRAEAIVAIDAAFNYKMNYLTRPQLSKLQPPTPTRLKVSANRRFLTHADNTPFFWLGDTAWEIAHRLDRSEVLIYLQSAVDNGINVIQFAALTELSQLTEPNAYDDLPLIDKNPTKPAVTPGNNPSLASEYDYWDHVDYIIDIAESLGIYVALLPSWGSYLWENKGQRSDPIFQAKNATEYGEWLGRRYAEKNNMIWVLGGDRIPDSREKLTIVRNMAKGLELGGGTQIKTYHPWGGKSSSDYFHDDDWLDFNSYQSGHPSRDYANYNFAQSDYAKVSIKPTIDIEPRYEHLPIKFNLANGRFDAYDTRQAAYWSLFAGAFGHTYGHNSIWQMYEADQDPAIGVSSYWMEAIHAEGRTTMKWLRALIEARPILDRIPDQSLIADDLSGANKIMGTRGDDYAFIYSSSGHSFSINMGKISGETVSASWYNPRTGGFTYINHYPNTGKKTFTPPSKGRGNDWVLVLDDKSRSDS